MKVGVVILNYKVADETVSCLKSVFNSNYPDLEVVVVDNNSGDGVKEKVKQFKVMAFIQTGENLGYAGGNNVGIKKAIDDGCEYVLILNPDTLVEKDTISRLVKCSQDNRVIVGPKIYFAPAKQPGAEQRADFKDSQTIWFAGGKFDAKNVLGSHLGVDYLDNSQFDEEKKVDFISGAAILVPAEIFSKIGLFDESYFLYLEDLEFCYRAKLAGYPSVYCPRAVVYHGNAKSTGLGSTLQDYFITRNRMLFASKYLGVRTLLALIREAIKHLGNKARRQALFDFLIGRFGKGSYLR